MLQRLDFPRRARAAGVHLLISGFVAALAAALVFGVWYPDIYRLVAGGRDLFLLITAVDVALGPLLTFAVFNVKKGWPHLRRDLGLIGLIQLAALIYGLYTVYGARPVAMVFEVDRFRVVTAHQVHATELPKALTQYQQLPLTGPWLLGVRSAATGEERNDALFMAIDSGIDISQRPLFWQPYAQSIPDALARARPLLLLLNKQPELAPGVRAELKALQLDENNLKFLPLVSRGGDWVVVLDPSGQPVHYIPTDGFF
jgi:hypothetical protein